MVGLYTCCQC